MLVSIVIHDENKLRREVKVKAYLSAGGGSLVLLRRHFDGDM